MAYCMPKRTVIEQLSVLGVVHPTEYDALVKLMERDQGQEVLEIVYLRELLTTLIMLDKKNSDLIQENTTIKNNITLLVSVRNEFKARENIIEKKKTRLRRRRSSIHDPLLERKIIRIVL
jgi:hypothetical protein